MRFFNDQVIKNKDMSTSVKSSAIDSRFCFLASAYIAVTGAAVGTIQIEVSNDEVTAGEPGRWIGIGTPVAINGTAAILIPATSICYQYIRISYVRTSGTGTLDVFVHMVGY
jgi:hypothetical protein